MAIGDKKHRELMTRFIEYIEKIPLNNKNLLMEIEKSYNHYGSRGFIDVLFSGGLSTSICEVKPVLCNLGEELIQLRKAHNAILDNAIKDFKNIEIIRNSYSMLKNVKGLIIDLYCEYNDEFYMINSDIISNYFRNKYDDPFLHRWEMCKNKESENDVEALQRAKTNLFLKDNR